MEAPVETLVEKILIARFKEKLYLNLDTKKYVKSVHKSYYGNDVYMIVSKEQSKVTYVASKLTEYFKKLCTITVDKAIVLIKKRVPIDQIKKGKHGRNIMICIDKLTLCYNLQISPKGPSKDDLVKEYLNYRFNLGENIEMKKLLKFVSESTYGSHLIKKEHVRPPIPSKLRTQVWRTYFGDNSKGTCFCCDIEIDVNSWHCGHILSDKYGGPTELVNLKPVCVKCNLEMKAMHMYRYMIYQRLDNAKYLRNGDPYVKDSKDKLKNNDKLLSKLDGLLEKGSVSKMEQELYLKKLSKEYPIGQDHNYNALSDYINKMV